MADGTTSLGNEIGVVYTGAKPIRYGLSLDDHE